MGLPDENAGFPDDARQVLARFAESARRGLLSNGWEVGPQDPATGDSIFLGNFQRPVAPDFVATVQFILESGPMLYGAELRPTRGVVDVRRVWASVGGELGVRHLPTERLLTVLHVECEADVSLDLAEIFEDRGDELPTFSDEATADAASGVLVDAVTVHALPSARAHADVDRMLEFVRGGGQTTRSETWEYMFVPTLLAASGRRAEARAALAEYQERVPPGSDEEMEYSGFRDRLSGWLR